MEKSINDLKGNMRLEFVEKFYRDKENDYSYIYKWKTRGWVIAIFVLLTPIALLFAILRFWKIKENFRNWFSNFKCASWEVERHSIRQTIYRFADEYNCYVSESGELKDNRNHKHKHYRPNTIEGESTEVPNEYLEYRPQIVKQFVETTDEISILFKYLGSSELNVIKLNEGVLRVNKDGEFILKNKKGEDITYSDQVSVRKLKSIIANLKREKAVNVEFKNRWEEICSSLDFTVIK